MHVQSVLRVSVAKELCTEQESYKLLYFRLAVMEGLKCAILDLPVLRQQRKSNMSQQVTPLISF